MKLQLSSYFYFFLFLFIPIISPHKTFAKPIFVPPTSLPEESLPVCPPSALSLIKNHEVKPGETLQSIASQYDLIPTTLMGINPSLQRGKTTVGMVLEIPPYNGIRVEVPTGSTWENIAKTYQVRADILFEINGCQPPSRLVFIPGINWSPRTSSSVKANILSGYPLPNMAEEGLGYGWQLHPVKGQVFFHSGIDLLAVKGTSILAIGEGIIAFAGAQTAYGNVVVINHSGGKQSRYAHLDQILVKVGEKVQKGTVLGQVGTTGQRDIQPAHLHLEIRYRSPLGWVAENPLTYVSIKSRF